VTPLAAVLAIALGAAGCGLLGPSDNDPRVLGVVTDRVQRPIGGALIEVLDGPLAGETRRSDPRGRFELRSRDGLPGMPVAVRISRDGFRSRTARATWQQGIVGPVTSYLWLDSLEPPIGLQPGSYTLSIALDLATATDDPQALRAPCAGFPAELATRTYETTISLLPEPQYSEWMYDHVVTADSSTLTSPHLFTLSVVGSWVGFGMEEEGIFEEFSGFRYLDVTGDAPTTVSAAVSGASVSIPFKAVFSYCELSGPRGQRSFCVSAPGERVVDQHTCVGEQATMVFTKR
jgi:hypothetical protein